MSVVTRAIVRMLCLAPVHLPAPGTVAAADLRTSMCDARVAVTLAMGGQPDIDGYATQGNAKPCENSRQLELFEVAA